MAITEIDLKLLWARAAGCCSAPNCQKDLTPRMARSGDVVLGEMAHVIGRKPSSARSSPVIGIDDTYQNLILLCPNHHTQIDKAEADFPTSLLLKWKRDWELLVRKKLLPRISGESHNPLEMRLWAYFNFDLVLQMYRSQHPSKLGIPLELWSDEVVDSEGFPLDGKKSADHARTVYETWPQNRARSLQQFYAEMVEKIIQDTPPIDLDDIWGIRKMQGFLYPSALAFLNRACAFKTIRKVGEREDRLVTSRARRIKVTFQIDTWNVYSNSSLTLHFRGTSRIAALVVIRSIERSRTNGVTTLDIKATPVALGTGFWSDHDRTPSIANQWYDGDEEVDDGDDMA